MTCSPDAITDNVHFAFAMWGVAAAIALALGIALYRKRVAMVGMIPIITGAAMHPAWWMSSTRGDCGAGLWNLAFGYTIAIAVVAGVVYWLTTRSNK